MNRYHLTLGYKRTTVSLDTLLADLLAIRLGACPQAPEAHGAVRAWLQHQLDQADDPGRSRVSQWLRDQIVLFLVDKHLSETYLDGLLESLSSGQGANALESKDQVGGRTPRGQSVDFALTGERVDSA